MAGAARDAIVIGGGLHGLSVALHLARRGKRVTVLERRYAGRHSSGINAGGVRRLGRDLREVALSVAAMEMWHAIDSLVGDDCGFVAGGQVKVAENDAELAKLAERAAEMKTLGYDHEELVDRAELRRIVPAIAQHCVGALVARRDGAADPYRTTLAFARAAQEAGAALHEDEGVVALEHARGTWRVRTPTRTLEAPAVVNCAGAWATRVAALAGETIPCGVKASMMIVTERMAPFVEPTIGGTGRSLSFKQTAAGTVVIGGGHQGRCDVDAEVSVVSFVNLANAARVATDLFPIMRGIRIVRTWCGIEARTSDEIPIIGPSAVAPGLFHSFGYSGHGFQLAPAVGAALAELIATGATNLPIAPFAVTRFAAQRAA
jgi:sarcosine oxidase subunit beta